MRYALGQEWGEESSRGVGGTEVVGAGNEERKYTKTQMNKEEQIFVDGIESIGMVDNTFRLELFVYRNGAEQGGQSGPQHAPVCQLITTAAGLARMQGAINQIVADLQAKAHAAAAPQSMESAGTGSSANFQM